MDRRVRNTGRSILPQRNGSRATALALLALLAAQPVLAQTAWERPRADSALLVRVLDVGQGDAILIENGGSKILVDGGPNPKVLGRYLDEYGLNGDTISVILTHEHADHYMGLRELFAKKRHIVVRYFWENQDPSPNVTLKRLRDQVAARVRDGSLTYRDTDDPCANGQPICTVTLRGGAKLHIMRPDPEGDKANNRSVALKLVGPDSAFTMWMAGDAEHEELEWMYGAAGYDRNPGMRVDVLKADHHGSCNGVTPRYLELVRPSLVVASLGAVNDYGHMHAQAKELFLRRQIDWYRTDQNGTVTLRWPAVAGDGYSIEVERGGRNLSGPSDRKCRAGG
jgi:competence protein ComEC